MTERLLPLSPEFDPATQAVVATCAAGLDDQLRRLEAAIADLPVEALEWQSAPGMNAVGMLAAHLALVEVWWIRLAPSATGSLAAVEGEFREILGIGPDDDGIVEGRTEFPSALRGKTSADYARLLHQARAATHEVLRNWTDDDLDLTVADGEGAVSWRWILVHLLEHFAEHLGQIRLIRHQLRDAGLVRAG